MKKIGALNSGLVNDDLSASGAGSSNADSNHPVKGKVIGIYIQPNLASESAPTITVTTKNAPIVTLLNVTTDQSGWYYTRTPVHNPDTGAVIANLKSDGIPVSDFINVAITSGYNGDNVDVWLMLE